MAQIIKQPNGKYCLFSGIVDDITDVNLDKAEIIEVLVEAERRRIATSVEYILEKIESGKPAYYQFTMTYEDALETVKEVHCVEYMLETIVEIEGRESK